MSEPTALHDHVEDFVAAVAAADAAEAGAGRPAGRVAVRRPPVAPGDPSLRSAFVSGGAASLVVLAAINGVDYAVSAALAVLAPDVERTLHLSDAQLLTTVSLTGLFFALASIPVGVLSDRRSRPRITGSLTVVAGLATIATGGVRSGVQLGGARVLTGAAQSGIQVTHLPLLADTYPLSARPRVFAVHSLMPSLAVLIGPLVAGPMAALIGGPAGWRWPFVLLGVVSVVLGLLALRLPEPGRAQTSALEQRPALGPSLARLLRIRSLTALLAALAVLGAVLITVPSLLSLYLERVQHLDASGRGVVAAVVGVGAVAGLAVGAQLGQRIVAGRPEQAVRLIALSLCLYAVLLSASLRLPGVVEVTAGATLASFLGQLGIVPLYTSVTAIVPDRLRSLAFALVGLAVIVGGGVVGSVVGGALSDDHGTVFALTALLLVTTPIAALVLLRAGTLLAEDMAAAAAADDADGAAEAAPGEPGALSVRGLSVSLGGRRILHEVSLDVRPGEVLALLGTNGAGKSTLLRALSGLVPVDAGTVHLGGTDLTVASTGARIAAGLVGVAGGRAIFADLSVADNLLAAAHTFAWDRERTEAETDRVLAHFPVLRERLGQPAGSLSGGEQQQLAVAKALLLRPRLLLVDELTLGLSPAAVEGMLAVMAGLRADGVTLVLVEQSLTTALAIADRAVFLERGRVRFAGSPAELVARDDLARAVFLTGVSA